MLQRKLSQIYKFAMQQFVKNSENYTITNISTVQMILSFLTFVPDSDSKLIKTKLNGNNLFVVLFFCGDWLKLQGHS